MIDYLINYLIHLESLTKGHTIQPKIYYDKNKSANHRFDSAWASLPNNYLLSACDLYNSYLHLDTTKSLVALSKSPFAPQRRSFHRSWISKVGGPSWCGNVVIGIPGIKGLMDTWANLWWWQKRCICWTCGWNNGISLTDFCVVIMSICIGWYYPAFSQ